jgi:multisubunit Na+/H+ antiporter MnhF subunit
MVKEDMAMTEYIYFAIFYILCCFIVIWRLIKGPTAPDRLVAGDCVDVLTDMALVLVAMFSGRGIYLDIAIVTAILGFLSQVLIGKYLEGTL